MHPSFSNPTGRCYFLDSEIVLGVLYKTLHELLVTNDVHTKDATNESRSDYFILFAHKFLCSHLAHLKMLLISLITEQGIEEINGLKSIC